MPAVETDAFPPMPPPHAPPGPPSTAGELRAALITGLLRLFAMREVPSVPALVRDHTVYFCGGEPGAADALCSWVAEDAVWVTLFKVGRCDTCIYFHELRTGFVASEVASLHTDCPSGTAFLAQIVLDTVEGGAPRPMIMVFDVLCVGDRPDGWLAQRPPADRYAVLREEQVGKWLAGAGLAVHWAGFRDAAVAFCTDPETAGRVPHRIAGVIQYTRGGAGALAEVPVLARGLLM